MATELRLRSLSEKMVALCARQIRGIAFNNTNGLSERRRYRIARKNVALTVAD